MVPPVRHPRVHPITLQHAARVLLEVLREADMEPLAGDLDPDGLPASLAAHGFASAEGAPMAAVMLKLLEGTAGRDLVRTMDPTPIPEILLTELAQLNGYNFTLTDDAADRFNRIVGTIREGRYDPTGWEEWLASCLEDGDSESWNWDDSAVTAHADFPLPVGSGPPESRLRKSAVVLGAATGRRFAPDRKRRSALVAAAANLLSDRDFAVHAPTIRPVYDRHDFVVTLEDLGELARAQLVVSPNDYATGIGIALAECRRTGPAVLMMGPKHADVAPLTNIIEDLTLAPALTPDHVRRVLSEYLDGRGDAFDEHQARLVEGREDGRQRYERFLAAIRLEEHLPEGVADGPMSARRRLRMALDIDIFLAEDPRIVDQYLGLVEPLIALTPSVPPTVSPTAQRTPPAEPSTEHTESPIAPDTTVPTGPATQEPAAIPTYSVAGAVIEPALFGSGVRVVRPVGWLDIATLTVKQMNAGNRAAAELRLGKKQKDRLFEYVAGVQYDDQVLAAAGYERSLRMLDRSDEWTALWTARKQHD